MKKSNRYYLVGLFLFVPFVVFYTVSKAQRRVADVPVTDGRESSPPTTSTSQTLDVSQEIPLKVKGNDAAGIIPVLVELTDRPLAQIYAEVVATPHNSKNQEQAMASAATRTQSLVIEEKQQQLAAVLKGPAVGGRELYRVSNALNGIAIMVSASKLDQIRQLPGVKSVTPIELEYPTNSTSIPFLGIPLLWENSVGLGQGLTGTGVKIGIIDTGIDYQHPNFGGTGLLADYQANDRAVAPDAYFPTAKVVGGIDFAGDAYNGSNTPVPDNDPMDCNGHGSHVAGTAAGLGVKSDGTTFTGPYNHAAPFASLRIGPGGAPGASLYAIRVFGCGGGTGLTVQGINWAMDPNGDHDLSDHLDVINMSLGSALGSVSNTTAVASENAALAGVIVVASAGNDGDTFFIHGAPAASGRTLSVAASSDSGNPGAALTVNSPPAIAGNYAISAANTFLPAPAPTPSGQTADIVVGLDAANGSGPSTTDGCTALTNAAAIAGKIALIDRGTCTFQAKANNAEAAGAIGVIIANNLVGDPTFITMAGSGSTQVNIPTVMISLADRNTIVNNPPANSTLAAATAADTLTSFTSRGPRLGLGNATAALKPDITAPGLNITSTQSGVTCTGASGGCLTPNASGFTPGGQALTISGTSMAAPHVTGIMALLRQLHPDWTVEELKALSMDGAIRDLTAGSNGAGLKYAPGRIGAGRVDPVNSAQSNVVAFNADDAGLVSLAFDLDAVGVATKTKKIRVVNKGLTAATYDLGITTATDAPGVSFSLPGGSSVTVPAGQTVSLDVQLNANSALMQHVRDATIAPVQAAPSPLTSLGNLARHWLTEESGYLTFSQSGTLKLRVPLYAALRPASNMSGSNIVTGGAPTGSTTIALSGSDICTGSLVTGPTCNGSFPTDEVSLVTPFELQVVSPRDPVNAPGYADIQYAGVSYSAASGVLMFGVSTWDKWSSPSDTVFNIYIDTDEDGTYDRILFNSDPGTMALNLFSNFNATSQDSYITAVFNLSTSGISTQQFVNRVPSGVADSALFNNNVMFLAATPASLGLTNTHFKYKIQTCPRSSPLCEPVSSFHLDEAAGPYFFNYNAQGLNFNGANLASDLNGATLPVTWNTANMTTNGSLGALLLHHHNANGKQAQVVLLDTAQSSDLALTYSAAPPNPILGQNVTLTLTVTNNGPNAATGVVVSDILPAGLTYVSDDGGGAYVSATGAWTVGALANAGSKTLHIVATVNTTQAVLSTAQITSASPLDTNAANNQASVTITSPQSADLALGMTVSSPTVLVGSPVTYTLTVKNNGNDPAYSLNVNDSFPAFPALNPTSFTASQGTYNPATGVWNLASLGKGFTATLALTLNAPNIAGSLTDQATASSSTSDPNNANNTASATTTVLSPANVSGTKTKSGSSTVGSTVTYTVVLSNSSTFAQQDNPGNEFTDVLPVGLTLVSASATSGTAVATVGTNTVTWNGSIPGSGSITITITATINSGTFLQTLTNQGTISYDADGNGTNEASRVTDDPAVGGASDPTSFTVAAAPTLSINDVSTTEGDSGTKTLTFTVTLSAAAGFTVKADYATADGTATAPSDYVATNNTLTFNPGDLTKTIAVTINGDQNFEPDETFTVTLTNPINSTITRAQGTGTITNDDPVGGFIQFSSTTYNTTESSRVATITVQRTGSLTAAVAVDYATPDDSAATPTILPCSTPGFVSARCDYTTAIGTLKFAAGESSKTFNVLISQDNYVESPESLSLTLSNPTGGATLGVASTATLTITDDVSEPAANPIDDSQNFVRQHYHDFLNREPDPSDLAGLAFWTNEIESCGADQGCRDIKRQNVSGAFFFSIEFQQTGYYVYRTYKTGFGDLNPPTVPVPVRYREFVRDTQEVQRGVVVGVGAFQAQLDSNKQAYALAFVKRPEFLVRYPAITGATAFVDALNTNAGSVLTPAERTALISGLTVNPADDALRANVLMTIAENTLLKQQEMNRAFVLMQYFGYLRRNPDAAPESGLNFAGNNFWLNKLNSFNGNFMQAEMVKAFITSTEYRRRSGQ